MVPAEADLVTSRTPLVEYGRQHPPARPVLAAGRQPALVAVLALLVVVGGVLAVWNDAGASAVAVLDLVLSGAAVVGICLVLLTARSSARAARAQALRHLAAARRAEAVAAEVRDEVLRLQTDLARLAARVETSHRWPARADDR
jgi:hypothetical protein